MVETSDSRTWLLRDLVPRLRAAVAPGRLGHLALGGTRRFGIGAAEALQVDRFPRLQVMLAGRQRTAFSHGGRRVERVLAARDAAFWCPDAWTVRPFTQRLRYLGLVFRAEFVRVIEIDHHPGDTPGPRLHYHGAGPLAGAGEDLLRALNAYAEAGDESEQDLLRAAFTALVLATARFLEAERRGGGGGRRELTWRRVQTYLDERHRDADLGRERAAADLDLNPTYLSELCTAQAGMAFNPYLRSLRIRRARHLLATSGLPIEAVARQTGFSSAGYFIKSFRRIAGETPGRFRARRGQDPIA